MQPRLIIDIDGTVMNGSAAFVHAQQAIKELQRRDIDFILATNSVRSRELQISRLNTAGIEVDMEQIYSPLSSINIYIREKGIERVWVVGTEDEITQIHARNDSDSPELIVFLDCEKLNIDYNMLQALAVKADSGCPVITASKSPYYFKNECRQIDTGAFITLMESVIQRPVEVLGKPALLYYENAALALPTGGPVWSVGDDCRTDIRGGKAAGFHTVLVRTGKYQQGDEAVEAPGVCIDDIGQLIPLLDQAH